MLKLLKYLNAKEWILLVVTLAFLALQVWCNISIPECTLKISQYLEMQSIAAFCLFCHLFFACQSQKQGVCQRQQLFSKRDKQIFHPFPYHPLHK